MSAFPAPEFNSGIDYLETMGLIIKSIHKLNYQRDYEGMYNMIKSLQIEVMGRIRSKKMDELTKRLKPLEKNCTQLIINKEKVKEFMLQRSLLIWFEEIQIIRHELGLVMPDKNSAWENLGEV